MHFDAIFQANTYQSRIIAIEHIDDFMAFWSEQAVRNHLQRRDCSLITRIQVDSDWLQAKQLIGQHDLFSAQKRTLLRIHVNKNKAFSDPSFLDFVQHASTNNTYTTLICCPKLTPQQHKSKNLSALKKHCVFIPTPELTAKQVPIWLQKNLKDLQITLSGDTIRTLVQHTQASPIRLWQAMSQLHVQSSHSNIDKNTIAQSILTSMHESSVFDVLTAVFHGQYAQAHTLLRTHTRPDFLQKLYWIMLKQLRTMTQHKEQQVANNQKITTFMQSLNLWQSQKTTYAHVLKLPLTTLHKHMLALSETEWVLKGLIPESLAHRLQSICLNLCKDVQHASAR